MLQRATSAIIESDGTRFSSDFDLVLNLIIVVSTGRGYQARRIIERVEENRQILYVMG